MSPTSSRVATRASYAALALVLTATGLAGCSGSGSSSEYAGASSAATRQAGGDQAGGEQAAGDAAKTVPAAAVDSADQKLARTASISLQVTNIQESIDKLRAISAAVEGFVLSENVGSYRDGGGEGVTPQNYAAITISVPTDQLDTTLDRLQGLGEVLDRRVETENVTASYVDTKARVDSMKRSVARIQDLISDTKDIEQLMSLERELSSRQSELEAVEARLQQLDRQTTRAPITIDLTTEPKLIEGLHTTPREGFVGGLAAGWSAFVSSLVALMAIVGALLPFALFALLIGWPLWILVRHLRSRTQAWSLRRRGLSAEPDPALATVSATTHEPSTPPPPRSGMPATTGTDDPAARPVRGD